MGILVDYDDDVERRNTHPMLLPKVEVEGVVSKADLDTYAYHGNQFEQGTGTRTGHQEAIDFATIQDGSKTKECVE